MEKEVDPEILKTTQRTLGKYVKRPQLTEKLLKKPPFRFLHDIVTTIIKTTGFFDGLFSEEELVSDNVKDRDSKIAFLNKLITVAATTTGKSLTVKPSKIVAGQEAEKTNELLQCIAFALDNNLSSEEAVKKYKDSTTKLPSQNKIEKPQEITKPPKKTIDNKKLTSKSSEKLTNSKRDSSERSLTRNDKNKVINANKIKSKEISARKETLSKKTTPISKTKSNLVEKSIIQNDKNVKTKKSSNNITQNNTTKNEEAQIKDLSNDNDDQHSGALHEKNDLIDTNKHASLRPEESEDNKLDSTSYTKIDSNLNSSLSSQDLMEGDPSADMNQHVDNYDSEVINQQHDVIRNAPQTNSETPFEENDNKVQSNESNKSSIPAEDKILSRDNSKNEDKIGTSNEAGSKRNDSDHYDSGKHTNIEDAQNISKPKNKVLSRNNSKYEDKIGTSIEAESKRIESDQYDNVKNTSMEDAQYISRPKSVRPSSSRPGAPRLREKHESVVTGNENLLVGKVNIIIENTVNEEEEDSSIIIVDHEANQSMSQDQQELQLSSNQQHGALVQQILDSQKEFSQATGKTEIEWQFGAQKAREAINQEIEELRFNIQAVSRAANPLGKVLDHIQEDVEVMRQELELWTKSYEEASKELMKQKIANEDSLVPLHTKLKQLDADIEEKRDKINDLKIIIHKNSSRIEKLLAGGDVQ